MLAFKVLPNSVLSCCERLLTWLLLRKQEGEAQKVNKELSVTYLVLVLLDPVQPQSQVSSAFLQAGKEESTGIMSFTTEIVQKG